MDVIVAGIDPRTIYRPTDIFRCQKSNVPVLRLPSWSRTLKGVVGFNFNYKGRKQKRDAIANKLLFDTTVQVGTWGNLDTGMHNLKYQ